MPPTAKIPNLDGRVYVVTGANTGIGEVTARELAVAGGHVILACRTEAKAAPVVASIKEAAGHEDVEFVALDLASLDSVRRCAEGLLARELPIHGLINNAGLAGQPGLTKEGFELAFGVNHVGHFLLTLMLLPRLLEAASADEPARIVNVASRAHERATGIDYEAVFKEKTTVTGMPEYEVSKLANVLFTKELDRRLADRHVHSYALHPGVVASDIWRRVPGPLRWIAKRFMITNEQGAQTTLHCAASEAAANESGLYYDECAPKDPNPVALDEEAAATLWDKSVAWTEAPEVPGGG